MDESSAWGAAILCYLMLARNSPAPPPSSPTPRKCCQAEANTLLFLLRGPESTWAWTSLLTPWMPGVGLAARALEAPWLRDIHPPTPGCTHPACVPSIFPEPGPEEGGIRPGPRPQGDLSLSSGRGGGGGR